MKGDFESNHWISNKTCCKFQFAWSAFTFKSSALRSRCSCVCRCLCKLVWVWPFLHVFFLKNKFYHLFIVSLIIIHPLQSHKYKNAYFPIFSFKENFLRIEMKNGKREKYYQNVHQWLTKFGSFFLLKYDFV